MQKKTNHPKSRTSPAIRILPEEVANRIAAGEVVERPASVVKELIENALDAGATRVSIRLVAAGRRTIEVADNGCGMSEQDAILAVERHATSKIRTAEDLDNIVTFGFRGEALASIAAVSRFELVTRRPQDDGGVRVRVEGGVLRDVSQTSAPVGTRVTVNRLYFNTPVRAKFLKGIATELSQCIDCVQRYVLSSPEVGFQLFHNDKLLLDVPEHATLRERIALIWGLPFLRDLVELSAERVGMRFEGMIGTPNLSRSSRSHQFFFLNRRPVINRSLQYGFEDGYHQLLLVGRRPVGVILIETSPRTVDVNIHPTKREVRFRDERAVRTAMSEVVRECLARLTPPGTSSPSRDTFLPPSSVSTGIETKKTSTVSPLSGTANNATSSESEFSEAETARVFQAPTEERQGELLTAGKVARPSEEPTSGWGSAEPTAFFHSIDDIGETPLQVFDTYLLVPDEGRLLIIDQHALHERLMYETLREELADQEYQAQRLVVPLLIDVPPSYSGLFEANLELFRQVGIEAAPFGGNTFQITAICHLYDESKVADVVYRVLEQLAQGDLFSKEKILDDLLRLAVEACRGAVKAGDRLTIEERRALLEGFRTLEPPYTCPHGRPIVTELTQVQMEKSFRRRP
ncbi:MAG TPA: DNA mismatch repair endonuclease MutL [Candidatus Hydrogenedentes bacterium]|nr:DNA mismatch repair endonuclease MutL [Candidatus Hydrogenedentota bacterium]HOL77175.1 DNA mismatch repair endonuclease MutL [Candidatus Hydrogenedentota bacterium]HPO85886.1 DNA mismatch repair endonuclease MutL [Candidatus Hydrogenedentota bacterium]